MASVRSFSCYYCTAFSCYIASSKATSKHRIVITTTAHMPCVCNKRVKPISNEKHFWGSAKSSFVMVTLDRFRSKFIKSLIVSGWLFFGFIRSQNVCVSLCDLHGFACNSVLFVCLCLCHDGNHFEQRLTTSNNQLFTLRRRY